MDVPSTFPLIEIKPQPDGGFVATSRLLPFATEGSTLEETIANIQDALGLVLECHIFPAEFGPVQDDQEPTSKGSPSVPFINLQREDKGGYIATSPVLEELLTAGDTPEEITRKVQDALSALLHFYQQEKRAFPETLSK